MRFGNLSNEPSPKVAIKAEAVIFNFGKLNNEGKAFTEDILHKGFNVLLITCLPERKVRSWCYKWAVPYTEVVEAAGSLEIPEICFQHRVIAYVDVDDRVLAEVRLRGNPQIEGIKWEQSLESHEYIKNHR